MGDRVNEDRYWEDFRNGKDLTKYGDKTVKKWDDSVGIVGEIYCKMMEYENKYGLENL